MPQGSVSWTFAFQDFPVWFMIILPKRFRHMYNFADDTATYVSDESLRGCLDITWEKLYASIWWFENDYIKLNTDKCHLLVLGITSMGKYRERFNLGK